jgi:hypothetical protein
MRTILTLTVLLVFFASAAHATTVLRVDVDDLTDQATVVVRGEVESVVSKWVETESAKSICTLVTLKVTRVLKGKAEARIVVTCPGGKVGDSQLKVSGVPEFVKGEKAVVFLWKNRFGDYLPLGMNQGRFRIRKDPKTGEETAENSLKGLAFMAPPDGKGGRRKVKLAPDSFRAADLEKKITDRVEVLRKAAEAKAAAEKKAAEEKKAPAEKKAAKKRPSAETAPKKEEKEETKEQRPGKEPSPGRDPAPKTD